MKKIIWNLLALFGLMTHAIHPMVNMSAYEQKLNQQLITTLKTDMCDMGKVINLLELKADPNARDKDTGHTALHLAAGNNFVMATQLLVNRGANINAQNYQGDTPLHMAARATENDLGAQTIDNHIETLLLKHHADHTLQNYDQETPAQIKKRTECYNTLIRYPQITCLGMALFTLSTYLMLS